MEGIWSDAMHWELEGPEFLTRTEASGPTAQHDQHCLGIFWITPEERFHELRDGAVLGRGEGCALSLEGPSASRNHARLERNGSLWQVRDLGSKNGTFHNAVRRELAPLGMGDTLRLGDWVGVVCRMPRVALAAQRWFDELVPGLTLSAPTAFGLAALPALAKSDVPIIVLGETGTGKERLALAIHELSGRSGQLISINCSAIPDGLAETELFGHRKGAFTGAHESSAGRIAAARGGSLLLDEILDLPLPIQAKLLRAIEERAVSPLGTSQVVPVDFRLITASQVRLDALVQSGRFRGDLYARLNGAEIELPPLRKRRQEVLRLLRDAMTPVLGELPSFDGLCAERLCAYPWPYNVREVMQLARVLCISRKLRYSLADLPLRIADSSGTPQQQLSDTGADESPSRRTRWLTRHAAELGKLKHALSQCGNNVAEASRVSGIPRHRARRLLEAEAETARRKGA